MLDATKICAVKTHGILKRNKMDDDITIIIKVGMCRDCKHYYSYNFHGYCHAAAVWQTPVFLATGNVTESIKVLDARKDPKKCGTRGWFFEPNK